MVVFNGGPNSFSVINKGKYKVSEVPPLDAVDTNLTWYKIEGTELIFAFNKKNLPKGITFPVSIFHKLKNLLRKKQKFSFFTLLSFCHIFCCVCTKT